MKAEYSKSLKVTAFYWVLVILLSGCAGTVVNMREVPLGQAHYVPGQGEALIVFMRPSGFGFAIQSSVFELSENDPKLIGILAAKKKFAYRVAPGEHLFMVIGESADFMSANLEKEKTYYSLITPRMGLWKARFSLKPIHKNELNSEEFSKWLEGCNWVESIAKSEEWAQRHMPSIQSKKQEYMPKWLARPENERPRLFPEDGL